MFSRLVPPLCLVLALAMLIVGFSMIAFGGPEDSVELHQARASGDESTVNALESDLRRSQAMRLTLIVLLLLGSGVMTVIAFHSMQSSAQRTQ